MVAAGIKTGPPDQLLIYMQKRTGGNCPKTIPACSFLYFLYIMMLGSKGFLTPLIPDCYVLCTPAIFKNIRNPLIFLQKMATYSCFWRVKRSEILLQASLHRIFDLLTLMVSYYTVWKRYSVTVVNFVFAFNTQLLKFS